MFLLLQSWAFAEVMENLIFCVQSNKWENKEEDKSEIRGGKEEMGYFLCVSWA